MRFVLLACATLCFYGCGNDNGASGADLATNGGDDLSGAIGDDLAGSGGGDMSGGDGGLLVITDGGTMGTSCTTACDCMPGLGCFGGKCTQGAVAVYCCNSTTCPSGDACQSSTGSYGRCGTTTHYDLGTGFDPCTLIMCANGNGGNDNCTRAGCSPTCTAGGTCQKL